MSSELSGDFVAAAARGGELMDTDGRAWFDLRSGIMTGLLGHNCAPVRHALREVIGMGLVNSYVNYSQNANDLRELLAVFQPGYQWHLTSTGAEAIDRALQIVAVKLQRSPRVGVIKGGFHGKLMHLAHARYDVPWGNWLCVVELDTDSAVGWEQVDVLLYEPIQSLTGIMVDIDQVASFIEEYGICVIADEMVTGCYRAGERFVSTSADMVVTGKTLGQGVPLAALGVGPDWVGIDPPVGWSTTTAGNNLSATVGLRVLEHILHHEMKIIQETRRIESDLRYAGCQEAYGALGFYYSRDPARTREALARRRILATVRDDGVLRLGPSLCTPPEHFSLLKEALEA